MTKLIEDFIKLAAHVVVNKKIDPVEAREQLGQSYYRV
jgi:hypothetical protein